MQPLLTPEAAFERFFAHWYDGDALDLRGVRAPEPLVVPWSAPGSPAADVQPLTAADQAAVDELLEALIDAAEEDWPGLLGVQRPVSRAWIDAFDRHYTPAVAAEVSTRADATEFGNEYLTLVGEFGVVLARVLQGLRPSLVWVYQWPYWDSGLLDPATGRRVNPFAWSMLKLTSAGAGASSLEAVDEGLRALETGG